MNDLQTHYAQLLGLGPDWSVESVDLSLDQRRVEIRLTHNGGKLMCPDCQKPCPCADHAPERTWRHLDTMQFETLLNARIPRSDCQQCGVKIIEVPWAGKSSRFTMLFEAFAIEVLQAATSVQRAAVLLGLNWKSVNRILEKAVDRGMKRRTVEDVKNVGMDEKSFLKGHKYVSLLVDLDGSRVLDVSEDRTKESADKLWKTLSMKQRKTVQAVAMDMWSPYMQSAYEYVPHANVIHDKFHISKHLNEAVDKVRRAEHKLLQQAGDERLKGSRQLWLYDESNLTDLAAHRFEQLKRLELKTSRAWAIKEQFSWFWSYRHKGYAKKFFDQWYGWASRCRLQPIVKVAKMLKRQLEGLINYSVHRITNAKAEGYNSKIQSIKANARGFHSFKSYRTRILFFCGKLNMTPLQP